MIRRMNAADLEQVAELEKICFSESWSYALLEAGLHSPYDVYYVYEQDEKILGYCNLRILAGEGELERIAVLPEYRRMGLAGKMMDAVLDLWLNTVYNDPHVLGSDVGLVVYPHGTAIYLQNYLSTMFQMLKLMPN